MAVNISKADIIWGYIAIFFNVASGLIVLPFILRMLTSDEIGYNYLMLTLSQMIALFDAGFSPMYGKNISYVFNGASRLQKEGLIEENSDEINYPLLAVLIKVAKYVYSIMSFTALILLLTAGTWYTYRVTNGFTNVNNALAIWIIYAISVFFNLYFSYYNALLFGSGKIKISRISTIATRISYIIISITLLYCELGLIGLSIANLVSPFLGRYIAHKAFFTKNLYNRTNSYKVSFDEVKENFILMWYNTKKMVISAIGSYCINRASLFIAGFYLTLGQIGSYGLMLQLGGIITGISTNYFQTIQPKLAGFMINGKWDVIRSDFSFAVVSFLILSISGFLFMIFAAPELLILIKSKTVLPTLLVMAVYAIVSILESNHSICSGFIIIGNKVPSVWYSLIPGFFIILMSWIFLRYTNLGILGLVIAPGICQLACNNWKWPKEALKVLHMTAKEVMSMGLNRVFLIISKT